jgi:hypothetical protein
MKPDILCGRLDYLIIEFFGGVYGGLTRQLHTALSRGSRTWWESSSRQTSHNLGLGRFGALRLGLEDDARTGSDMRGGFELR